MAIDSNEDAVIKASEIIEHCLICDSTSEAALNQVSFDGISQAIVTIGGNIQATILTTILLKERGVKKISVRIDDDHYEKIMYKIGADEVIFPERIAGIRYANSIIRDNITDYFNVSDGYGIVQILINIANVSLYGTKPTLTLGANNLAKIPKTENDIYEKDEEGNIKEDDEGKQIEIPGFRAAYNAYDTAKNTKKWNIA